jgi:hypothetical protein
MLTAQRADLAADRTRMINRLRARLLSVFPALERALDFTNQGPLVLISQFQTPEAIRAIRPHELESWLRSRKVRGAGKLATAAAQAAAAQRTRIRGEAMAAALVADLAGNVLELDRQLALLDKLISDRFRAHRHASIIASMVGIGDLLDAEFLAATGGDMTAFASANHLAGCRYTAATAPTRRWIVERSPASIRHSPMSAVPATTGSDRCCTTISRGRPQPRCPAITGPPMMSRTGCVSRAGRGTDSSTRRVPTTHLIAERRGARTAPAPRPRSERSRSSVCGGLAERRASTLLTLNVQDQDLVFETQWPIGTERTMALRIIDDVPAQAGRAFVDGSPIGPLRRNAPAHDVLPITRNSANRRHPRSQPTKRKCSCRRASHCQ